MSESSGEDRKIIIDEDWKSQVEAEREAQTQPEPPDTAPGVEGQTTQPEQLPPASFSFLVTTLATQTMVTLGQIPDPVEQKPIVRMQLAKHHIDSLSMLQEKTKGNLTSDESTMLDEVLHQLRILFVQVQSETTGV